MNYSDYLYCARSEFYGAHFEFGILTIEGEPNLELTLTEGRQDSFSQYLLMKAETDPLALLTLTTRNKVYLLLARPNSINIMAVGEVYNKISYLFVIILCVAILNLYARSDSCYVDSYM